MERSKQKYKTLKRYEIACHARALNFSCFKNQPFLKSQRACIWFRDSTVSALTKHNFRLWAFCLMPTHVHMIIWPETKQPDVARFLESLKKSVTRKALLYARDHAPSMLTRMRDEQPNGKVAYRFWQRGGGYDRNLRTSCATWKMIRYVHMNPVEDELCSKPEDWYWSSAGHYASKLECPIPVTLERLPPQIDFSANGTRTR